MRLIWKTTSLFQTNTMLREQALSETATGCYRLITARLAPTVQRWLRTLSKVTPAEDGVSFRFRWQLGHATIKHHQSRRKASCSASVMPRDVMLSAVYTLQYCAETSHM